jgi:hypothetical protein
MKERVIQLPLEDQTLLIKFGGFDESIDADDLTRIHYENLYGDAVTSAALMNRIGILRAAAEKLLAEAVLDCNLFEAELKQKIRKQAKIDSRKITEAGIEEEVLMHASYRIKKQAVINNQHVFSVLDSMYWSASSKDKKLSGFMAGVKPKELEQEIFDTAINGFIIKKVKNAIHGNQQ